MDSFFGIGMFELVMIAIIALVVLGPERLPSAIREVAKWIKQLRSMSGEFQSQFSEELKILDELDPRRILNEALDPNAKPTQPATPAKAAAAAPVVRTVAPAAPAAPAVSPVVEPVKVAIPNAETNNSILPPPVLPAPNGVPAVSDSPVEPAAADGVAAQPAARDDNGAEAVQ